MQPGQTFPTTQTTFGARAGAFRLASVREVFGMDLRTMALFRVGLGLLLIVDLVLRARDLRAHYTDFGILPRDAAIAMLSDGAFSLHLLNGTAWFQAGMFLIAGAFAAMLMVGWRTRFATIASWVLLLSLQNRNPTVLSGEDNLLMVLCFWAMFLPLGLRYSVDAALDRKSGEVPSAYFSIATLALLVQGMSMYLFSALLKSDAQWMPDGAAVYYALQLDYLATPFALWLRQFGDLLQGLTWYVWTLEIVGPILIFSPLFSRTLRTAFLAAFVTMHLGFLLCLEIGIFPLVSILMNLAFVPGWMWDRLAATARPAASPAHVVVYYDRDCAFCHKVCRLLTTFLILPGVPIRAAQSDPKAGVLLAINNSWVVSDGPQTDYLKWDAVRHLVACSPGFHPLAKLLAFGPLAALGDRFYDWVADNRSRLGRVTETALPWRPTRLGGGMLCNALAGIFLVFVTWQNLTTLPGLSLAMPRPLAEFRQAAGLWQDWTMFAPHPEMNSPWPIIVGELRDHTLVDVYNRRSGVPSWDRPPVVAAVYENHRWRKYLSIMEDLSYEKGANEFALNYARWVCRSWNENAPPGKELAVFNIHFNVEWSMPDYRPKHLTSNLIWRHDCFA